MGCIGMSLDDFERCTPSEFYAAWKQWHEQMERMERSSWERMRTLALVYVQPYSKHALSAHELLPLPWDEESKEETSKPDRAETVRRYAAAKQRNGLK